MGYQPQLGAPRLSVFASAASILFPGLCDVELGHERRGRLTMLGTWHATRLNRLKSNDARFNASHRNPWDFRRCSGFVAPLIMA
jgi:hypothetical protein